MVDFISHAAKGRVALQNYLIRLTIEEGEKEQRMGMFTISVIANALGTLTYINELRNAPCQCLHAAHCLLVYLGASRPDGDILTT